MAKTQKYVVKERKLLNISEGTELAVSYVETVQMKFGKGIVGKVIEANGDAAALIGEEVIIPVRSSLANLEDADLRAGDVIALKHDGMKKSKNGREYINIRYTIYREPNEKIPF